MCPTAAAATAAAVAAAAVVAAAATSPAAAAAAAVGVLFPSKDEPKRYRYIRPRTSMFVRVGSAQYKTIRIRPA